MTRIPVLSNLPAGLVKIRRLIRYLINLNILRRILINIQKKAEVILSIAYFLEAWCKSSYAYPLVRELFEYLEAGTLIQDLVEEKILVLDEQGKLIEKWKGLENKPAIFQMVTGTQADAFVRFVVDGVQLWKDPNLVESFTHFYQDQLRNKGKN